jgi:1-acyl-sn-glycerol-3-phosphate acyltransferase
MLDRINYLWRLCATAISFFVFGVVGLMVWVMYPVIMLFLGQGELKKRRGRYFVHRIFHYYVELMRGLGILTYEVHGGERLNRPARLVVANHPSLIDVVFLISLIQNATCIVKRSLISNFYMRAPIRVASYLYADDPEALLDRCTEELRGGSSLIVFPEGTRTKPNQPSHFQRGAANIALQAGTMILPVYIHCSPTTLTKHEKWYRIPSKIVVFRLYVGEDIDPVQYGGTQPRSVASRRLTHHLEQYFAEQEVRYGKP